MSCPPPLAGSGYTYCLCLARRQSFSILFCEGLFFPPLVESYGQISQARVRAFPFQTLVIFFLFCTPRVPSIRLLPPLPYGFWSHPDDFFLTLSPPNFRRICVPLSVFLFFSLRRSTITVPSLNSASFGISNHAQFGGHGEVLPIFPSGPRTPSDRPGDFSWRPAHVLHAIEVSPPRFPAGPLFPGRPFVVFHLPPCSPAHSPCWNPPPAFW